MIPVGGRTSYLGDVLAIVVAETRQAARQAAELVTVTYDVLRPDHRRGGRHRRPRDRGVGHRLERAQRVDLRPGRRRRRPPGRPAPTGCTRCSRPSASSTPSSSRSRPWPCPAADGVPLYVYSGGQGVWDDRNQIASVLGARARPGHGRAGVERRRVRRQGGHEQPGPDRAGRLAAAAPGEVHAHPRAVAAHAPEAPPDPPRVPGRLRRRRPPHGDRGPHDRRLGLVRVGRHEGARAGGRPRRRARTGCPSSTWSRSRCAPTTRRAARSAASAPTRPSSPWRA